MTLHFALGERKAGKSIREHVWFRNKKVTSSMLTAM
jgi:hypothetical protein